jgi:hypothetical protein
MALPMTEIDVALTDFLLAAQAGWFAWAFRRNVPAGWLRSSACLMFGGLALAALAGGLWHGFLTEPSGLSRAVWWLTMLGVGAAASGYVLLGAGLLGWQSPAVLFGVGALAVVYAVLSAGTLAFYPAVIATLLATVVGMAGLVRQLCRPGTGTALVGAVAIALAAIPQQLEWGLEALNLSHNAVYHLLLLGAHYLLYRGLQQLLTREDR